jgi:hypothetical protein
MSNITNYQINHFILNKLYITPSSKYIRLQIIFSKFYFFIIDMFGCWEIPNLGDLLMLNPHTQRETVVNVINLFDVPT